MRKWTRRAFIGAGSLVGGGFVLGAGELLFAPTGKVSYRPMPPKRARKPPGSRSRRMILSPFWSPHCEMGQGARTALAMMAAEEMDADWNLVRVREAPALDAYANAYMLRAFAGTFPHRSCGAWTGERIAWRAGSAPRRRAAPRPFAAPGNTA